MKNAAFGIALLCAAPQMCGSEASESVTDRMKRQRLLLSAQRNFTTEKCHETVDEVHKNGKYTEESITPICEREMKWEKCDFFAEALSLSTSHPDFNKTHFCTNMDQAHFCSSSMDSLLMSLPVSDLAYGQCTRAKPKKSDAYCKKFQRMFAYAVQSEDLDTIRACYMIQAYSNMTSSQKELEEEPEEAEKKPVTPPPKSRIITSSSSKLEAAGKGEAHGGEHRTPEGVTKFGDSGIVVKPQPLEDFGAGKGHFVSPSRATTAAPTPAPEGEKKQASTPPPEAGTIIVEPVAATEALVSSARSAQAVPAAQPVSAAVPAVPASPAVEMREVVVQLPASVDAAKVAAQLGGHLRVLPVASAQPVALQVTAPPRVGGAKPVLQQAAPSTRPAGQHVAAHPAASEEKARAVGASPPHAGLAQVHQVVTAHAVHVDSKTAEKAKGAAEESGKKGTQNYNAFMSGFVDSS